MKVNVFKIDNDKVDDLTVELEDNGFECEADNEDENSYTALYLRKKRSENKGWLGYYQQLLSDDKFTYYTENIGSETVSGLFLIQKDGYSYVLSYGQSQVKIRLPRYHKVVDKDILKSLNEELDKHFLDFITEVDVSDYWLTGVSFNFSNDYRYSL